NMAADLKELASRSINVITNGFDKIPPTVKNNPPSKEGPMRILHLGSLSRKRNPENFWKALKIWINMNNIDSNQIKFDFTGNVEPSIFQYLDNVGLHEFYIRNNYIPHKKIWDKLFSCDILFLIGIPMSPDIIPGKLFEYLSADKPILSISPNEGDINHLLKETGAGLNADFDEPDKSIRHLDDMYQMYRQGILQESFHVKEEDLKKYTRENLTEQLAQILDEVTGASSTTSFTS